MRFFNSLVLQETEKIDLNNLPSHIAVIMDGNGRWAKKQGAKRIFGHYQGIKAVRETVECAAELGVKYLTLYTFSTENWTRPKIEVDGIMQLLIKTIVDELPTLMKNDVKLSVIGDMQSLPTKAKESLEDAILSTKNNRGLNLCLALSYSGKWDIVEATKKIVAEVESKILSVEDINETIFNKHLATKDFPDVDLMIRTGGDHRISNYLLWQSAYAELLFLDSIYWPEFRKQDLVNAIITYQQRERRFGKTGDQIETKKHKNA